MPLGAEGGIASAGSDTVAMSAVIVIPFIIIYSLKYHPEMKLLSDGELAFSQPAQDLEVVA